MEIILAEMLNSDIKERLVEMLTQAAEDLEPQDREDAFRGLVEGFFRIHRKEITFHVRPLVGAAAVIVSQAPKHPDNCECQTCILKFGLEYALHETEAMREAVAELGRDAAYGRRSAQGKSWETVRGEMLPKLMAGIIETHTKAVKEGRY